MSRIGKYEMCTQKCRVSIEPQIRDMLRPQPRDTCSYSQICKERKTRFLANFSILRGGTSTSVILPPRENARRRHEWRFWTGVPDRKVAVKNFLKLYISCSPRRDKPQHISEIWINAILDVWRTFPFHEGVHRPVILPPRLSPRRPGEQRGEGPREARQWLHGGSRG